MRTLAVLSVVALAALLLTGTVVLAIDGTARASVLTTFGSEDELRGYLEDRGSVPGIKGGDMFSAAEAGSYSGTNNQVQGVEEGDKVKTDGSTLFIADEGIVRVIGTVPSLHNITTIAAGAPSSDVHIVIHGLHLLEGRLVVVSVVYEQGNAGYYPSGDGKAMMCYPYWSTQRTVVEVFDVSDPARPVPLLKGGVSGAVTTTRMIGTTLYVVAEQYPWSGEDIELPRIASGDRQESVPATAISYDPACPEASFFVNLLAFDAATGDVDCLTVLAAPSSVVYMSTTALYLTMSHWGGSNGAPFTAVSSTVSTGIYRVPVGGDELSVAAQGSVEGSVLNQFALDERDERLRVATTMGESSAVHVLNLDLGPVGSLDGIAPGERIYSCRFIDDRLYLVTFRQIDPLFVIDLSDDEPRVLGELKVPGASTYLQLVEEGLLGIGFEGSSLKVSLFNVTDDEDPREVGSYVLEGYSYSSAQYDHHAVLYDARHNLLVIPMTVYGLSSGDAWHYYGSLSSALVLSISSDGIAEVGRIDHGSSAVERSVLIDEVLYTISGTTVKANALPSLAPSSELVYSEDCVCWY